MGNSIRIKTIEYIASKILSFGDSQKQSSDVINLCGQTQLMELVYLVCLGSCCVARNAKESPYKGISLLSIFDDFTTYPLGHVSHYSYKELSKENDTSILFLNGDVLVKYDRMMENSKSFIRDNKELCELVDDAIKFLFSGDFLPRRGNLFNTSRLGVLNRIDNQVLIDIRSTFPAWVIALDNIGSEIYKKRGADEVDAFLKESDGIGNISKALSNPNVLEREISKLISYKYR